MHYRRLSSVLWAVAYWEEDRTPARFSGFCPAETTASARLDAIRIRPTPSRRSFVSLVIRFSPPSLTAEQYDEAVRRLTEAGVFPADGLDYELCFGSGDNLKVSQVWDSREQLDAFGERLRPILAELEINPGEPEVLEV